MPSPRAAGPAVTLLALVLVVGGASAGGFVSRYYYYEVAAPPPTAGVDLRTHVGLAETPEWDGAVNVGLIDAPFPPGKRPLAFQVLDAKFSTGLPLVFEWLDAEGRSLGEDMFCKGVGDHFVLEGVPTDSVRVLVSVYAVPPPGFAADNDDKCELISGGATSGWIRINYQ